MIKGWNKRDFSVCLIHSPVGIYSSSGEGCIDEIWELVLGIVGDAATWRLGPIMHAITRVSRRPAPKELFDLHHPRPHLLIRLIHLLNEIRGKILFNIAF